MSGSGNLPAPSLPQTLYLYQGAHRKFENFRNRYIIK
jgi:hypothetical protein